MARTTTGPSTRPDRSDRPFDRSPSRFLERAFTSEGMPLMRVHGTGDLYLADSAQEIHLMELDGDDSLTVTGSNVLAHSLVQRVGAPPGGRSDWRIHPNTPRRRRLCGIPGAA